MATWEENLQKRLTSPFDTPVYYFASTEDAMLQMAARQTLQALLAHTGDSEVTRIDGPAPDLGQVIAAAGAISFFGTPRIVELYQITPSAIKDKDAEELATLFAQLENAVLVVTCLYKDSKAAGTKKAKALLDAAARTGFAAELAKPTRRENIQFLHRVAAQYGAQFEQANGHDAAEALLDRAGEDHYLLENEVAKLAACCGYGTITEVAVTQWATHNIEADVFELARMITGGQQAAAYAKLDELLWLRHEPIAIAAALAGSYVDMYRVRIGADARQSTQAVFREMGYRGSDYRLKKAGESARRYSPRRLEACILCLAKLDRDLKSSALPDKTVLLQATVGQLLALGAR